MTPDAPKSGHKSAYMARARARYIRSTQQVIAERGSDATIEDFALHADVAIATLYKHFGSKEGVIVAAIEDALLAWEGWLQEVVSQYDDPIEQLVMGLRLGCRVQLTHPLTAKIGAYGITHGLFNTEQLAQRFVADVRALAEAGLVAGDNVDLRAYSLFNVGSMQLVNPSFNPADADALIEIALPLIGISPAKAKRLAHLPLPELPAPPAPPTPLR